MSKAFLQALNLVVGERYVLTEQEARGEFLRERRGLYESEALAVVLPGDTKQVSEIVKTCAQYAVSIVPQSGNTGLCGGTVSKFDQIILNLKRLNRVRKLDLVNFTMTVEAGCILSNLQQVAAEQRLLFPLSLAAEGSCMIGGNLATNAGGVNVLHYGNTRDLTLGLEAVLPNGEVWNGLSELRKNNSGYDLKNLFIGSEGTLGIITAAVLKLFSQPANTQTMFVSLDTPESAVSFLTTMREQTGDRVIACEIMSRQCLEFAFKHISDCHDLFDQEFAWYLLLVVGDSGKETDLRKRVETILSNAFSEKLIRNALISDNQAQAKNFWRLREGLVQAQKFEGVSIKHDIAIPVSRVPDFLKQAESRVSNLAPGTRICAFGHLGDGNIHYNISQPLDSDGEDFRSRWREINDEVYEIVLGLNGSFSAEHGIGLLKLPDMHRYKDGVELNLMKSIKQTLDPGNIMNPGKLVPE